MRDPKQVLDEAIDEAFAREPAVTKPITQPLGRIIGAGVAATAATGVATALTVFVTRRRAPAKPRLLRGKYTRHFGFGRYRLGHFGTAFVAYSYKLPELRFQLPRGSYKVPAKFR
jgi:hypothetical protein